MKTINKNTELVRSLSVDIIILYDLADLSKILLKTIQNVILNTSEIKYSKSNQNTQKVFQMQC